MWLAMWCLALALGGGALAPAAGRPWFVERVAVASTTDWDLWTAPSWTRQVVIRNAHASAALYVGNYDETGAFVSGSDDYVTLPAGAAIVLPLTPGAGQTQADHYVIPLASSTASHPVEIVLVETPE